jgi:cytoskeletal protein RodZ
MIKITAIPEALHRPVSRRLKFRRSTGLMVVLFLGLGTLWLDVRTPSTASASSKSLDQAISQNLKPGESLIITRPGSTTTVAPSSSTTLPTTSTTHPPGSAQEPTPSTTQVVPTTHSPTTTAQVGESPPATTAPSRTTTTTSGPSTPNPAATNVATTVGRG